MGRRPGSTLFRRERALRAALPVLLVSALALSFEAAGSAAVISRAQHLNHVDPSRWAFKYPVDEGPIGEGDSILIVTKLSGAMRTVSLNSATGAASWTAPTTLSAIPPAQLDAPVSLDGVALVLGPSPDYFDGYGATIEGINLKTGSLAWSERGSFLIVDSPSLCPGAWGSSSFCLVLSTSPTSPALFVAIAAKSGRIEAKIPDVSRRLAPSIYETVDQPQSLIDMNLPNGISWATPVTRAFGEGQYSANAGWRSERFGGVDIVSLGSEAKGRSERLSNSMTVGLSASTGDVLWHAQGDFQCGGASVLVGPYMCLERGTISSNSSSAAPTLSGVSVVIAGVKPDSGKIAWRYAVGDPDAFIGGDGVAIASSNVLVVPGRSGVLRWLDVATGLSHPTPANQPLWCRVLQTFSDQTVAKHRTRRVAADAYVPCTGKRQILGSSPSDPPPFAIETSGYSVWASPAGLLALRLGSSHG